MQFRQWRKQDKRPTCLGLTTRILFLKKKKSYSIYNVNERYLLAPLSEINAESSWPIVRHQPQNTLVNSKIPAFYTCFPLSCYLMHSNSPSRFLSECELLNGVYESEATYFTQTPTQTNAA